MVGHLAVLGMQGAEITRVLKTFNAASPGFQTGVAGTGDSAR